MCTAVRKYLNVRLSLTWYNLITGLWTELMLVIVTVVYDGTL